MAILILVFGFIIGAGSSNIWIGVAYGILQASVWMVMLVRFGLLATVVTIFTNALLNAVGILTPDFSRWYAGAGIFALVVTLALALNNLLTFPYGHGFTVSSLTRLLEKEGFRVVAVLGDVLVRTADRWTRPWAAAEERALKTIMRLLARGAPRAAPWVEVYARS